MTASETVEILRKMIGCHFTPPCGEEDICDLCEYHVEEKDEKMALETAIELIGKEVREE